MSEPARLDPNTRADFVRELFVAGFHLNRLVEMTDEQVALAITAMRNSDGVCTLAPRKPVR